MELVGYAEIKKDATTGMSAISPDLFKGITKGNPPYYTGVF